LNDLVEKKKADMTLKEFQYVLEYAKSLTKYDATWYLPAIKLLACQATVDLDNEDHKSSSFNHSLNNFLALLFIFKSTLDEPYSYVDGSFGGAGMMSKMMQEIKRREGKRIF
jgi:hypothetical protein